jgi:hypothetical protein
MTMVHIVATTTSVFVVSTMGLDTIVVLAIVAFVTSD